MPRNPRKRRCSVEGCRAWAMRGQSLCSSHLRSRALRERSELIMPLLLAVGGAHDGPHNDVQVIDEELEKLRQGRAYFRRWVQEFRDLDPAERRGLSPWAFLRAWNDSTARILQLLRERRALCPDGDDQFGELMRSVYDELEKSLELARLKAGDQNTRQEARPEAGEPTDAPSE